MLTKRFNRHLLVCAGILLTVTAAVAGSGVGGVFNLGQTNTVNARTVLQGNTSVQQLHVVNQSTAAGSVGVVGAAGGTGLWGKSVGRVGVRASATGTTGTTTDFSARQHRGTDMPVISATPGQASIPRAAPPSGD